MKILIVKRVKLKGKIMGSANILNLENDGWKTGKYPLFLGQELGLHDTINRPYPEIFNTYKLLKSIDWSEDEVNLKESRADFLTCDKMSYDVMIKTLSWQWELDSVASRSIIAIFAPFISNSDLNQLLIRISDTECLHTTTYSEIIRQCISDPQVVIEELVNNEAITKRSSKVTKIFSELKLLGAQYTLDRNSINPKKLRKAILRGVVALYCLEGAEFMASFACTFALAERDLFMTVAALVQKIMIDESLHARADAMILEILLRDPVWAEDFESMKGEMQGLLDEIYAQEVEWSRYIFSEGRSVVGLTTGLLTEWVQFKMQDIYDNLGLIMPFARVENSPLPWMERWMDIDNQQVAAQETDVTNYRLNSVIKDEKVGYAFDFGKTRGVPVSKEVFRVFTKDDCPYCVKLKKFMDSKGFVYQEILVKDVDREALASRGLTTVPQVFDMEGNYRGDCTSFSRLYA